MPKLSRLVRRIALHALRSGIPDSLSVIELEDRCITKQSSGVSYSLPSVATPGGGEDVREIGPNWVCSAILILKTTQCSPTTLRCGREVIVAWATLVAIGNS